MEILLILVACVTLNLTGRARTWEIWLLSFAICYQVILVFLLGQVRIPRKILCYYSVWRVKAILPVFREWRKGCGRERQSEHSVYTYILNSCLVNSDSVFSCVWCPLVKKSCFTLQRVYLQTGALMQGKLGLLHSLSHCYLRFQHPQVC